MTDRRTSLEVIAETEAEALAKAEAELGLPKDAFDVEVLDEGTKGLWGFGQRQARYRLTVRATGEDVEAPEPPLTARQASIGEAAAESEDDDAEALRVTVETIEELLERMGVAARVEANWGQADSPDRIRPLQVDIRGDDLSILIGRRGETLASLQYITRLIVGKELRRPVAIIIDIEGYRARRERQLRQLARRVANQAVETSRIMSLEPMPANERRIIHIELRDNPDVETESVGEGNRRKVTIIPK
jgi:spoIIIJ-associated protein